MQARLAVMLYPESMTAASGDISETLRLSLSRFSTHFPAISLIVSSIAGSPRRRRAEEERLAASPAPFCQQFVLARQGGERLKLLGIAPSLSLTTTSSQDPAV